MRFRRGILALAILLVGLTLPGCYLTFDTVQSSSPQVVSLDLATDIDPLTMAPLTTVDGTFPAGTKEVYAVARVENLRTGTQLKGDWYYDVQGNGQYELVYSVESTAPGGGNRYVAINLFSYQDALPVGSYKVVVLLDDQVAAEREFQIR